MGMFNSVRCRYRLPDPEAQDLDFQTKSMVELTLDNYEITADGQLLHEAYDVRIEETKESLFGYFFHKENCRWEPDDFTGELEIHMSVRRPEQPLFWYSYVFDFQNGRVAGLQHGPRHGELLPNPPSRLR